MAWALVFFVGRSAAQTSGAVTITAPQTSTCVSESGLLVVLMRPPAR